MMCLDLKVRIPLLKCGFRKIPASDTGHSVQLPDNACGDLC